jgi:MATE efflux family protein
MMNENRASRISLHGFFRPRDLTEGTPWKTILAFAFPIIISYLLQQVYTISDAAIVGQTLTAGEVAGVNDTSSLIFIFLQFAFGVSAGFCVVTAAEVGARDDAGVRRSLSSQIILSAALTVVLTGLALLLLRPMLAWINVTPDSPEVYRAAYTYCAIIFAGIGAQLFYNFICSFLRSMGDSVTPLLFLLFSTILNIGLDLLFIVSFRWGVAGAAIATIMAQLISTAGCFLYAFIKYPKIRLRREDWKITGRDILRHLNQGLPLGLQFSVLAIGIIVMQSVVVKFDILGGEMVSHAAQNGFGAANKLNSLLMTPLNGLGAAMTSYTAQNKGAGRPDRIKKGTVQALMMVSALAGFSILLGLWLSVGGSYLKIFLSADKITAETIRYGNTYLYVDLAMYLFLGFIFVVRNCVQGIGESRFILGAGTAELAGRVAVCLLLPALLAGGEVSAAAPRLAFYALCAADPAAWIAADAVLMIPFLRDIMRKGK